MDKEADDKLVNRRSWIKEQVHRAVVANPFDDSLANIETPRLSAEIQTMH